MPSYETEGLAKTMERCARIGACPRSISASIPAAYQAANMFAGSPTPNLLILETRADGQTLLEELGELAERSVTRTRAWCGRACQ
jgi:pilus assembly protein CpaE